MLIDIASPYFLTPLLAVAFFMIWALSRAGFAQRIVTPRKARSLEVVVSVVIVVSSGATIWFLYSVVPYSFWEVFPHPGEAFQIFNYAFLVLLPVILAVRFLRTGLKSVRLKVANWKFSLSLGLLASIVTLIPTVMVRPDFMERLASANWSFFVVTIFASFSEETLFRGFFQTQMESLVGTQKGIFIAALSFQLWHIPTRVLVSGLTPGSLLPIRF